MEEVKEVEIIEEKTIVKPEFNEEIKAEIKSIGAVEDNISKVKDYAINLQKYYENVVFTEETKKDAEIEKAEINKFKDKVKSFRKQITEEYNKPIKVFEETAKETEKILEETYAAINSQVKHFDDVELQKIKETCEKYFNEYAASKKIDFVTFENMNVKIIKGLVTSTGALTKKTQDAISEFINQREKDLDLIRPLENADEILVEYKKTLKCADSIALVMDRHKQLEEMQQQKEEEKEQKLNDEVMLNKIDECLTAPSIEDSADFGKEESNQKFIAAFEVISDNEESFKIIAAAIKNSNSEFRQLSRVGDHYE